MKTKLKDMTSFWNEQHKDNQYFDCKNDYKSDLIKRYNDENSSLISMGLDDGMWGSDDNSDKAFFNLKKNGKIFQKQTAYLQTILKHVGRVIGIRNLNGML